MDASYFFCSEGLDFNDGLRFFSKPSFRKAHRRDRWFILTEIKQNSLQADQ